MANGLEITVVGNLTADPEIRTTASGVSVVSFTVAHTPRKYDSATSTWTDLETMWLRCTAWREFAESISNNLSKGSRVVLHGALTQETYQAKDGESKTSLKVDVLDIGLAIAKTVKQNGQVSQSSASYQGWTEPVKAVDAIDQILDEINAPF